MLQDTQSSCSECKPQCLKSKLLGISWHCLLIIYLILIIVFALIYRFCQCLNPQSFYIPADLVEEKKLANFQEQVQGKTLLGLSAEEVNDSTLLQLIDESAVQTTGATVSFTMTKDGMFSVTVPTENSGPHDVIMFHASHAADIIAACDNEIIMWAGNDRAIHPLGNSWAAYYTELLLTNGYDSYCINSSQRFPAFVTYGESRFPTPEYQLLEVEVKSEDSRRENINLLLLFDAETFETQLWADVNSSVQDSQDTTTRDFYHILPYCLNELDYTRIAAKAAATPSPSCWDLLYFSTITITTTGYGDVLPNTTYVRFIVMAEILLGTILFGLFLAKLGERFLNSPSEQRGGS